MLKLIVIVSLTKSLIAQPPVKDLYVGCYYHPESRSINYEPPKEPDFNDTVVGYGRTININRCISMCRRRPALYAAIRVHTCNCGNSIGDFEKRSDSECNNNECSNYCGSEGTDAAYQTCPKNTYGDRCEKVCYCVNGRCNQKTGECQSGCLTGYVGWDCSAKNPCLSNPCKNGGTCKGKAIKGVADYKCNCPVGFSGNVCENTCPVNSFGEGCAFPCRCKGNVKCEIISGVCPDKKCAEGYQGDRCDIANNCEPNPCKNGGTCYEEEKKFFCLCLDVYYGTKCENKLADWVTKKTEIIQNEFPPSIKRMLQKKNRGKKKPYLKPIVVSLNKTTVKPVSQSNVSDININSTANFTQLIRASSFADALHVYIDAFASGLGLVPAKVVLYSELEPKYYLGCFRDSDRYPDLTGDLRDEPEKTFSFRNCRDFCRERYFTLFGIQNGTACRCGHLYGSQGILRDVFCDIKCPPDDIKTIDNVLNTEVRMCGGINANSVYSVCPIGRFGSDCKQHCNCLQGQCNFQLGVCPSICKLQFVGPKCDLEDENVWVLARVSSWIILCLLTYFGVLLATCLVSILGKSRMAKSPNAKGFYQYDIEFFGLKK